MISKLSLCVLFTTLLVVTAILINNNDTRREP